DRCAVGRRSLDELDQVLEHLHQHVALDDGGRAHQVALDPVDGGAVADRQGSLAGVVGAPSALVLEGPGHLLDPSGHARSPCCSTCSWSWVIPEARKLHVFQNSSSCARPAAFSEYTLRGGPFSEGTLSTSTSPRCSTRTSSAYTVPSAMSEKPSSRSRAVIS